MLREQALEYASYGLNCLPFSKFNKLPYLGRDKNDKPLGWKKYQEQIFEDYYNDELEFSMIGFICGKVSGSLEVIDIDSKNDPSGNLWDKYKALIQMNSLDLFNKLVIESTTSGGIHIYYRCNTIFDKREKLAKREPIGSEIDNKVKSVTLIETCSEKCVVVCSPSKGYTMLQKDFSDIPEITEDERDILISCARVLDERTIKAFEFKKDEKAWADNSITPWDDFDKNGDPLNILTTNGWVHLYDEDNGDYGKTAVFMRPGKTGNKTSAHYYYDSNIFYPFTSSTEFEPMKGYTPSAVYCFIMCGGDFRKCARELYALGYGTKIEDIEKAKQDIIAQDNGTYDFISSPEDEEDYLNRVRSNSLEVGLSTGFKSLDPYYVLKRGNLVLFNAFDNVGKTTVVIYLALCSALYHDWRWVLYTSENKAAQIRKKLIEFYCGQSLAPNPRYNYDGIPEDKYQEAVTFIRDHFIILKNNTIEGDDAKGVLDKFEKCRKLKRIDAVLIDPYNSLEVNGSNEYAFHKKTLGEFRRFAEINNIYLGVCTHAYSKSARNTDANNRQQPPKKADIEFGQIFCNKADDQLCLHRYINDYENGNNKITHIIVYKIKDTDTGGMSTPYDDPVQVRMDNKNGWYGFWEVREDGNFYCPILEWHKIRNSKQSI